MISLFIFTIKTIVGYDAARDISSSFSDTRFDYQMLDLNLTHYQEYLIKNNSFSL